MAPAPGRRGSRVRALTEWVFSAPARRLPGEPRSPGSRALVPAPAVAASWLRVVQTCANPRAGHHRHKPQGAQSQTRCKLTVGLSADPETDLPSLRPASSLELSLPEPQPGRQERQQAGAQGATGGRDRALPATVPEEAQRARWETRLLLECRRAASGGPGDGRWGRRTHRRAWASAPPWLGCAVCG